MSLNIIPSYQQLVHLTRPGLVLEQCVQRSLTAPCQMLVVTPPPPQLPHGRHLDQSEVRTGVT